GPRSCRTPARLERRKSRRDLRRPSHRTSHYRTFVLVGQRASSPTPHVTQPTPSSLVTCRERSLRSCAKTLLGGNGRDRDAAREAADSQQGVASIAPPSGSLP